MTDETPAAFVAMLDAAFRGYGVAEGLPPRLRAAVMAVPRHRFVHRFRIGDGPLQDADADPAACRVTIYSDQVMRHVDADGAALPSSNSQPSYVLWLLHLLDLQPGARVLEIGSGSGWLAAIMAQLVGPAGSVTGIEILPDLAAQSRLDLAGTPVQIITGDGTAGATPGAPFDRAPFDRAPFDRAMITAGTWDVPAGLLDQVVDGGAALIPIELRGEIGCQVSVLRRRGDRFVAEQSVAGWFVPLLGSTQTRSPRHRMPDGPAASRHALPLGGFTGLGGQVVATQFRAFLARTEPDFAVFAGPDAPPTIGGQPGTPFGLLLPGSTAVWQAGTLAGYGSPEAPQRLAQAYAGWCDFGLPGMGAFTLEVVRTGTPPGDGLVWPESRGSTTLLWRLPPEPEAWKRLLASFG